MKLSTVASLIVRNIEVGLRKQLRLTPRPYKLLLELTEHCNSRCQTCSIWKKEESISKKEFSLEMAEDLFSSYGKNLFWLALSGGEITMYQNLPKLVELIKTHCPRLRLVTFTTNGLNPQKAVEYAQLLMSLGADLFVTISLDGDEKTHDEIRGIPGNYKRALETQKQLQNAGIKTHWGITLSDLNHEFVRHNKDFLQDIKAATFAHGGGIYKQQNSLHVEKLLSSLKTVIQSYKIESLSELFEWFYIRLSYGFVKNNMSSKIPCEVISTNLHIKASGEIHPCMFVKSVGNLKDLNLPSLLKQPSMQTLIQDYRKNNCPGCWMNCYAPHSMMQNPIRSIVHAFRGLKNEETATYM